MEEASEKFLASAGQPNISIGLENWSVGKTCLENPQGEPEERTIDHLDTLIRDSCRLEYIVQFSKALMTSAAELLTLHEQKMKPLSLRLSRGLNSIPDELLADIINLAVHHGQTETQDALRLSHVSRRFRYVCLEDKRLWSTIRVRGRFIADFFEHCVVRSGPKRDLHMALTYSQEDVYDSIHKFAQTWSSSISRCRSLALSKDDEGDGYHHISEALGRLMQKDGLVFPRLHELSLGQCCWPIPSYDESHLWDWTQIDFEDVRPWVTPNLRVLRCIQYIPPPSFPFTSFTTFSLSFIPKRDNINSQAEELLAFMARQGNIKTLELELDSFDGNYQIDEEHAAPAVYPGVTNYQLKMLDFDAFLGEEAGDRPFWRILRMPNLESISLLIDNYYGWGRKFKHLSSELSATSDFLVKTGILLPPLEENSRLSSLTINMLPPETEDGPEESLWKTNSLILDIPLYQVPHVVTIVVTTFCQVAISHSNPQSQIDGPQVLAEPSHLRELKFSSCENFSVHSLRKVVKSLKDAGAWETLERVILQDCKSLDFEAALEVIGKQRFHFER